MENNRVIEGPIFCEHDPYSDDTVYTFVVRCSKCPCVAYTTKTSGLIPKLGPWLIK